MWHIVLIGYIFTTLMFSIAQPSWERQLIYLFFWTILPTWFSVWVVLVRRRNKIMKMQEDQQVQQNQSHNNHAENEKKLPENE